MRKSFLAGAFLCATSLAASAADLPMRSAAPAPAPMFVAANWSGFYIGLNAGYTFSQNETFVPGGTTFSANPDPDAFGLGAQIGYRHQYMNGVVIGVEADASWLTGKKFTDRYLTPAGADGGANAVNALEWDASIRASLGYSMGAWLPYVSGGVAFTREKGCTAIVAASPCAAATNFGSTRTGWTIGAGVAYAISRNLVANVEYRYSDFGRKTYTTPGVNGGTTRSDLQTHKVLVGLSWKFGGSAAPVVARY